MWRKSRRAVQSSSPRRAVRTPKKSTRAQTKLNRSKVAQKRSRVRLLIFGFVIIIIASFVGALSWISFSSALAVQTIKINGNQEVRTRAVENILFQNTYMPLLGLFSQQNTLLYPAAELEGILLYEFPKIESVVVDSQLTKQQVLITIVERKPYAHWCAGLDEERICYLIDETGFVYEKTDSANPGKMIIFEGGIDADATEVLRTFIEPRYFKDVRNFLKAIQNLDLETDRFIFEGIDGRVFLKPDWEIRVALDKDLAITAVNLEAILNEYNIRERLGELSYIDMRFGERVYHTFKEKTDTNEY